MRKSTVASWDDLKPGDLAHALVDDVAHSDAESLTDAEPKDAHQPQRRLVKKHCIGMGNTKIPIHPAGVEVNGTAY